MALARGGPADRQGPKGETRLEQLTGAERAIVRRIAETRATVPHIELATEVGAERALALARERGCSLTAILVRACAVALTEHPRANGAYRDGHYELYSRVNVAVTVQTDAGYVAPTVLDADRKSLAQLHAELEASAARARAGELSPPEFAGATFTLTEVGEPGIARASALVTPPQAAALAAGAVRSAAVVRDGSVVPGHVLDLSLACDGRILFGAHAARFLARVAELMRTAV